MENKYYNAKQMKTEAPEEAIEEFLGVPALEEEKGDWGFKGLKQAIKLEFKLARYDQVGTYGPTADGEANKPTGGGALQGAPYLRQISCHS